MLDHGHLNLPRGSGWPGTYQKCTTGWVVSSVLLQLSLKAQLTPSLFIPLTLFIPFQFFSPFLKCPLLLCESLQLWVLSHVGHDCYVWDSSPSLEDPSCPFVLCVKPRACRWLSRETFMWARDFCRIKQHWVQGQWCQAHISHLTELGLGRLLWIFRCFCSVCLIS